MKTTLLVTLLLFAVVLVVSAGASKPSFSGITLDTLGNPIFNFGNLNPSTDYQLQIIEQGGTPPEMDLGPIVQNGDGTGSLSFAFLPADMYEVILTEIRRNGNLAHNPAVDEIVSVP